jgi:lactoylglutathione lyase
LLLQAGEAKQQFSDANELQKVAGNVEAVRLCAPFRQGTCAPAPRGGQVRSLNDNFVGYLVGSSAAVKLVALYQFQPKSVVAVLPIKGVYEIAIRVKDLARAEAFYKDVLGLTEGLRDDRRNWLFLYAGAGMVVLQEDKGEWPTQHFAFAVTENDINRAAQILKDHGVAVSEPVYHEWMKSVSVYFDDPDGHALELLALSTS